MRTVLLMLRRPVRRVMGTAALLGPMLWMACGSPSGPKTTGLQGLVTVGPIGPHCNPGVPCAASVEGTFTVTGQGRPLAVFTSDAGGHYTVYLPPGGYRIVPSAGTPIPFAGSQVLDAVVAPGDTLTTLELQFDSGLR